MTDFNTQELIVTKNVALRVKHIGMISNMTKRLNGGEEGNASEIMRLAVENLYKNFDQVIAEIAADSQPK